MIAKLVVSAAACVLGAGCLWANNKSDSMAGFEDRVVLGDDGRAEGGQAHAMAGYAGLYIDAEASVRDAVRPPRQVLDPRLPPPDPRTRYHAIGLGLSLRASLPGIVASTHELERHLDFGGEAGFGGALVPDDHTVDELAAVSYGAWVEVGTIDLGSGYLAITAAIRREVTDAPWIDQTQLAIGLAWRWREPIGERPRWRD